MVKCPFCKAEVTDSKKEWDYSHKYYHVKGFTCHKCGINFKAYFHSNKFSHTIPKSPDTRLKIAKYLIVHQKATNEEIAKLLKLDILEVNNALLEMEKQNIVYSTSF